MTMCTIIKISWMEVSWMEEPCVNYHRGKLAIDDIFILSQT